MLILNVFTDPMSGVKITRFSLETTIDFVRSGDTSVVWRLDRLGRKMEDLISILNRVNECEVTFHSLQENIPMDESSSTGQLMPYCSQLLQNLNINFRTICS
ncbi:resolvase [Enterococcus sp. AZ071]